MGLIAGHDTAGALDALARLYGNGKDVGSVLEELSSLARDLLLRKTAPQGGAALLTGGYDEAAMRALGEQLTAPRLLQMLKVLQNALPDLARSANRRTDAELCLIRLSDERLDDSFAGLAAGWPVWRSSWPAACLSPPQSLRSGSRAPGRPCV